MKKYKKTYAILHLAEKHTVFSLGKTKVHVSFTGGIVTKKGVTPATFTTDDPIVQLAIETSKEFKKGAVTLQSCYPMKGEVKIGMNPPKPDKTVENFIRGALNKEVQEAGEEHQPSGGTLSAPDNEAEDMLTREASGSRPQHGFAEGKEAEETEESVEAEEAVAADEEEEADVETDGPEVVEVSCKDVAKQYLQEHYGENPAPLRTIANVQECAAKYGITFMFV